MSAAGPAEFENAERMVVGTSQQIYDAFNDFIFSADTKVLGKLVARTLLAQRTAQVPGDIVECGVFKGSGVLSWLKLKRLLFPNTLKKVVGFDYFDTKALLDSLSGADRERMDELFAGRSFAHERGAEELVSARIAHAGFGSADYELVRGDIAETAAAFVERRPGFRISLLYLDLDLAGPTYAALAALWPRVTRGGLVVFDEYAVDQWSEAQGVDSFFADQDIELRTLDFPCPTAYVRKD